MPYRVSTPGAATTGRDVRFRPPTPSDGRALWHLAGEVGLDLNSPYAYVLWGDHFAGSSLVAVNDADDEVVGFTIGFHPPDAPDTLFVWQIGVSAATRGAGIGGRMLDDLLARTGARWLDATVTPSNEASAALFRATAVRHDTEVEEVLAYPADMFPGAHEPEVRFRIGPLDPVDLPATQGT